MQILSNDDINIYNSPDEQLASEHFLHKTLEQVEVLFQENSAYYQEDLMWMGPKAFQFYLPAVTNYIKSTDSIGDDHVIDCLYEILLFRWNQEGNSLATSHVDKLINSIITEYEKFDIDESIYGNLKPKYQQLQNMLITEK